jgi:hypothetical protein
VRPALEGAGLPSNRYKFHPTRHYGVRTTLRNGVSLPEVAASVGDHIATIQEACAGFLEDAPHRQNGAQRRPGADPGRAGVGGAQ